MCNRVRFSRRRSPTHTGVACISVYVYLSIQYKNTHAHVSTFVQYTFFFFAAPGFYEQAHIPLLKLSSSVGLTNPAAVILDLKGAMNSEGRAVQRRAQ